MRSHKGFACFCEETEDLDLQRCHSDGISTKLSSKCLKKSGIVMLQSTHLYGEVEFFRAVLSGS